MTNEGLKKLIEEQFHKDNYIIQTDKKVTNSCSNEGRREKYTAVYCSSNGVYKEDTVECFQKTIIETDNYEWYMNRFVHAEQHIFIRDISKRFYQFGINDKGLENFEKIADMIKNNAKGNKIITIGSSSGAMAAIVLGKILNAEYTIAFSPLLKPYKPDTPKEEIEKKLITKEFFDAVQYAKSNIPIFFIYPDGSSWDIYNSSLVKDFANIHFLPIKSNIHGVPVNKRILRKILESDKERLKEICTYKTTDSVSEYKLARIMGGNILYLLRIFDYIKKYPLFFLKKEFYTNVVNLNI